ncbi:unnamed protein product [Symbiodinium pilosum]|uniref:Uncharacterized protein n=1 Tax=Symbiodinium pilosum TaxID=2952 RepID=A0A812IZ46_SYMPI|nr:unnamed protein product [Symbiodinium pilosum]
MALRATVAPRFFMQRTRTFPRSARSCSTRVPTRTWPSRGRVTSSWRALRQKPLWTRTTGTAYFASIVRVDAPFNSFAPRGLLLCILQLGMEVPESVGPCCKLPHARTHGTLSIAPR